jgi:hypothetical protein
MAATRLILCRRGEIGCCHAPINLRMLLRRTDPTIAVRRSTILQFCDRGSRPRAFDHRRAHGSFRGRNAEQECRRLMMPLTCNTVAENRTRRFARMRFKHRPASSRPTAGGRLGRHQWLENEPYLRWGSRRTAMLALPPCSRSGSTTALQAAHRPRLSTLENQVLPTNSSDDVLY